MPLTEKDINLEIKTLNSIINNIGKFDVNALKYKVNAAGHPMLYAKGKGYGKNTECKSLESESNMQKISARNKADAEFKKLQAESEKANKLKSEQLYTDEMKKWRDFVKLILKRGEAAKKEYEEKLKQKAVDQNKKDWYADLGTMFDE